MVLFPLNCLKDHWIPWINLIKERHRESRNGGKRERKEKEKERKGGKEGKGGSERRDREREFSMSSNIYGFTVT